MKKNKNYYISTKQLFDSLGGYTNIKYFTHCMTRMRFQLHNQDLVDEEGIKNSDYASGVNKNKSNGEYQIIIGADVPKFYKIFCEVNSYDEDGKTILEKEADFSTKQASEIKAMKDKFKVKGFLNTSLAFISKVFSPIVIPLVGYGLILTLWSLLTVEWNGPGSIAAASSHFIGQVVGILDILVGAFSLFITVVIGYTVFKAMQGNGIYGIIIAVVLTAPGLVSMGDVKPEPGQSILQAYEGWTLFGEGIVYPWKINFNGLIIPMIIVAILGAYIERGTEKISNNTLKMILAPVLIIGGTFIFAIFIMAPIGLLFTNYLSIGINWLSTNLIAKYVAIPIIAGLYGPLVITGLHHSLTPIILQGQATYGATVIQGFITISNISQGVASIAFMVMHRRVVKMKDLGISNGVSAIVGGITEPSLYTINLKHLYPLIACSIGVFSGTLILVASNTYALQGSSSIFGILMYLLNAPDKTGVTTWIGGGYLWGVLSILTSCLITFSMTIILGKTKFFWNRSRELILADYHEDIDELKKVSKKDWKDIIYLEKSKKTEAKMAQKAKKNKVLK
ncbi:PTS transporter subunit EIIC [Spiroplasma alleghenense]|uniref:PTS system, trehalose-specific IIBC component n=1 Tax=Spiroplasma alleghenense TaxID=216931 RepID=A0A345Z2Z6_9MOLU|nr:PTS transporter subunit EIIC [Spiroplasma alleghenense]AXK50975.1 PTS system, trehalose-specific IIBC component [Spiroplasma alleghenense]